MPTSKQRREAERRRLQRQLRRRADRDVRRRRGLILLTVVNLLLAIGAVVGLLVATSRDEGNRGGKAKAKAVKSSPPRSSRRVAPSTPVANAAASPCTWKKTGTPSRPVQPPATTRPPR